MGGRGVVKGRDVPSSFLCSAAILAGCVWMTGRDFAMRGSFCDRSVENVVMMEARFDVAVLLLENWPRSIQPRCKAAGGNRKIGARTNQRAELGQFCCATWLQAPLLWLTKPRARGRDTICDLPSRLEVGDDPRATPAPFPSRVSLSPLLLRDLLLSRSPMDRRR